MSNYPKSHKNAQKIVDKYELDETDKLLLKHILTKPGITDDELGVLVGLKRRQVNRRKNRPSFKAAHADYSDASLGIIRKHMAELTRNTIKTLKTTQDERLRVYGTLKLLAFEKQIDEKDLGDNDEPQVSATRKLNGEIEYIGKLKEVEKALKEEE